MDREDLIEFEKLEKVIDIEDFPNRLMYDRLVKSCISFTYTHLLTEDNLQKLNVNYEDADKMRVYTDKAKAFFFDRNINSTELFRAGIATWEAHDKSDGPTKALFRFIVMLCNEYNPADEKTMQDPYLFYYFAVLADVGVGYCAQFRRFLLQELSQ